MDVLAAASAAAAPDVWRWQPHPEVWVLLASLVGLYAYAVRVIGPKVVPAGQRPVSRRQLVAFAGAVLVLWAASDYPVHDLSEEYLFSVHMVQHLLLTLVMPPLFLLATPAGWPTWCWATPGCGGRCGSSCDRWRRGWPTTPSCCSPTGRRW